MPFGRSSESSCHADRQLQKRMLFEAYMANGRQTGGANTWVRCISESSIFPHPSWWGPSNPAPPARLPLARCTSKRNADLQTPPKGDADQSVPTRNPRCPGWSKVPVICPPHAASLARAAANADPGKSRLVQFCPIRAPDPT